jgi:hypothetical protein
VIFSLIDRRLICNAMAKSTSNFITVGVGFGGMVGSVFFFCLGELRFWSREMKGTIERLGDGGL